ncbi:hypothetical protein [Ectopseudomonas oleovorans]|uniref:DUF4259 domain-containing protein n=1 Tax=Ectopseudomonas oleovorans TaxID=301 RepID=A0AA42QE05_ECTOL|nr:hypothetical protein [Pseudomonas oleovorans]MDH1341126.1 hypothetical protein [Pseudomonas oleovorans]MDH1493914.1 hypothetical protein [Pseudomonas oleovorans]WGG22938.1 hypothetical protein N5O83_10040 [Pseudomonas oleovorans]
MGAWGSGLYQDDYASDLKNTISLVCKIPWDGERLLEVLWQMQCDAGIDGDDECTFWLVVADQFERRGIACSSAIAKALAIIDDGQDIRRMEELEKKDIINRQRILLELADRLRSPRQERPRPTAKKPPEYVVEVGDIYAYPTMKGKAVNSWFPTWEEAGFEPDGWGALVVLQKGRAFDWLPWVSVAALTVPHELYPSLDDALKAHLLTDDLQTEGAAKVVPKRSHFKRMKMELIGRVPLNKEKAERHVSTWSDVSAIDNGWSLSSPAFSSNIGDLSIGSCLADLLEEPANKPIHPTANASAD